MSLKERLWDFLKSEKCLTEIYDEFCDETPSTIRGRLNENVGVCFKRIARGVYLAICGDVQAVIIQGDSWSVLKDLEDESIDAIVMDSPYSVLDQQMQRGTTRKRNLNKGWDFETKDLDEAFYLELHRVIKPGGHMFSFMPPVRNDTWAYLMEQIEVAMGAGWIFNAQWVWDKKKISLGYNGRPRHELIHFFSKGKRRLFGSGHPMRATPDVLAHSSEHHVYKKHQTQKPIELIARLVGFSTQPNEVVLDPFGGSLSTAAACLQMQRNCITIEIDGGMIRSCMNL